MNRLDNLILLICILSLNYTKAQNIHQNLIPNGSFEKLKSQNLDSFPRLSDHDQKWIEYFGTNYFFNKSFFPLINAPKIFFGHQEPKKGNGYYYLTVINNVFKCSTSSNLELQSYAQIKLHKKLRKKNEGCFIY